MEFYELEELLQRHFEAMSKNDYLFEVDLDKDKLWNLYLDSFPEGTNEIFRERREFDCSCCRTFIRNIGNVVTIEGGELISLWDICTGDDKFQPVLNELSEFVKSKDIKDVYFSPTKKVGTKVNRERLESGEIIKWNHFYLELPEKFVNTTQDSIATLQNDYRTTKEVFKRSLEEISKDSIETVLELISQNSLYRGDKWKDTLKKLLKYKEEYLQLMSNDKKDVYAWETSVQESKMLGKIRNHSIGTLLVNISEGMPLDIAVNKYEEIVAPENYQRPKPVYTKKMLEKARDRVKELGLMDALYRRHAKLDDISVNDILFVNRDSAPRLTDGNDIFDEMSKEVNVNPKKLSRVQEVTIDKFVDDILPGVNEMEVLLENRLEPNMVSLVAPKKDTDGQLFKWGNLFSWAYKGNLADSSMRERVKSAGGNINGVLRFSIQWNDSEYNPNDFDAHCEEPDGTHIYYGSMVSSSTKGELDVDIINPEKGTPAVENIAWPNLNNMRPGDYELYVKNYSHNGGKQGFSAEIEFNGEIHSFEYNKELRQKEEVPVATVHLNNNGNFEISKKLDSSVSSKEIWNLNSNQFHPVSVMMLSPNYWEDSDKVGNKHFFFMLENCQNPEEPNSFYNEFLRSELREERKVLEALGSKMSVETVENQLSGVGFSKTQDNYVVIKVTGNVDRTLKIKF
ncbi:MAG: hypothetical protein ACOCRO_01195 [Halanaerobiales bacterium]